MSDLELTRERWAMARQAGAAFRDEDPGMIETPYGDQPVLPGMGPQPGALFRNRHTGSIGTVVRVTTRRRLWVTLRHDGRLTEIPGHWLGDHWRPCRPDGSLL